MNIPKQSRAEAEAAHRARVLAIRASGRATAVLARLEGSAAVLSGQLTWLDDSPKWLAAADEITRRSWIEPIRQLRRELAQVSARIERYRVKLDALERECRPR